MQRLNIGCSDPKSLDGKDFDQWMKATVGITGLQPLRALIDGAVWHLDVDSACPGGEAAAKGWPVLPLKCYVSWVQTAVRQVGSYLLQTFKDYRVFTVVRKESVV